jgi:carbamoyltransferase
MNVLGIYGGFNWNANHSFEDGEIFTKTWKHTWIHASGATLFKNGNHVTSISEERLTRIKYEGNYPQKSIDYCLSLGDITNEEIDLVCVASNVLPIFHDNLNNGYIFKFLNKKFPNAKVKIVSHHASHACASIFTSGFNDGSFLIIDGAGSLINYPFGQEMETSSIGYFNKKKGIFRFFNNPSQVNNFGDFYHHCSYKIFCELIEKDINLHDTKYRESYEGKIMGLSAYGDSKSIPSQELYVQLKGDYEDIPYVILNKNSVLNRNDISPKDKAAVLQRAFEEALMCYIGGLSKNSYLEDNVCFGGGSFLNILANSKIKLSGLVKDMHIHPATDDTGLHFGAACYGIFKNKEQINISGNLALVGKEYSDNEIKTQLDKKYLKYDKYKDFEKLCEFTAEKLNENKIIAWFQGRSEFGPRALGARSLLMHPGTKESKDIMNERVKHREYWRPFAGIILEENLLDYFEEDLNSPYMLYSLTVKKDKINEIAAITHEDNTCRAQTVNEELNPHVTTLLRKFNEVSGLPILMNTSFNDNGEPIIETPEDAVRAFLNMDIDYLVIGNFIVSK